MIYLQQRWQRFLSRRLPASPEVVLTQRRLFIFPTRVGFFFLFCLLVMLVAAINYQNNMSYALSFLLANVFVVAVLHTYANLSGLILRAGRMQPVFCGGEAEFVFSVQASGKACHHALLLQSQGGSRALLANVQNQAQTVTLSCAAGERGWLHAPRIKVSSVYPLGLLRCWSWVDLDMKALVYPRPVFARPQENRQTLGDQQREKEHLAGEDFYAIRPYRHGDPLKHIHWPALARSQTVQTRVYALHEGSSCELDWGNYPGLDVEARLSALCEAVLVCEQRKEPYTLRLPTATLERGIGSAQRAAALKMLALYQRGAA